MREEMIEAARRAAEGWPVWDPALAEAAIEAGLVDGDRIHLGGDMVAELQGDQVTITSGSKQTVLPLSNLTDQQRERMLVLKAAQAGRKPAATGRPL